MCGLCGVLGVHEHWTDSRETLKRRKVAVNQSQERAYQVRVANRLLSLQGLRLRDWQGRSFVVSNRTGASEIVNHLAEIWLAADKLSKKSIDPLDPELILALDN